jgi:predicted O-linked N-acetylglucosamine transferase (SPINDLY family)
LTGNAFAGRVGASLLTAIGLPELIAATSAEYEDLAVHLATDEERLAGVKQKLARNRLTAPLFDTGGMAGHLESGYADLMARYQAELAPEHIHVSGGLRGAASRDKVGGRG